MQTYPNGDDGMELFCAKGSRPRFTRMNRLTIVERLIFPKDDIMKLFRNENFVIQKNINRVNRILLFCFTFDWLNLFLLRIKKYTFQLNYITFLHLTFSTLPPLPFYSFKK